MTPTATATGQVTTLSLDVSGTGPTTPGELGTFLVTLTASGPTPGPVTVTLTLPAGVVFVSGGGNGITCFAQGQLVTCVHPDGLRASGDRISSGARAVVSVPVTVRAISPVSPDAVLVVSAVAPGITPVTVTRPEQLPTPTPLVPEPPVLWLFGSGLLVLGGAAYQTRRR